MGAITPEQWAWLPAFGTPPEDERSELLPAALPQRSAGGPVDYPSPRSDA